MLGGPEQVSATSEAAGGDSRRGDFAAPAETELYYMEKFIEKYRMEKDGRQILLPNWLRRKPASRGNDEIAPETLTGIPLPAPAAPKSKKVKFFEKTAGARATRSTGV